MENVDDQILMHSSSCIYNAEGVSFFCACVLHAQIGVTCLYQCSRLYFRHQVATPLVFLSIKLLFGVTFLQERQVHVKDGQDITNHIGVSARRNK